MLYRQGIEHCGAGDVAALRKPLDELVSRRNIQAAPLLNLPSQTVDLAAIEALAVDLRGRFSHFVVAGIGGSGLSGKALLEMKPGALASFDFLENIDPETIEDLLSRLDTQHTCFLIISKSGGTVETLSQFYVLIAHVESTLGKKAVGEHFVIITEPGDNPLRRAALEYGMRALDHPADIGGRFAILTAVGLLPAAIAGLDIRALRKGAQSVVERMDAPATGAALHYGFMQKSIPMAVLLPYSQRLSGLAMWWRQCWAESLGKQGKGSTPIPGIGTTDQHSQLQLWLDGPKDKFFTLITLNHAGRGPRIEPPSDPALDYIRGRTIGDVMEAEQRATLETLIRQHCPVRVLALDSLAEEQMGALLMHFMIEIILTAALLGVDPFGQPAVEEGKRLAKEYLGCGDVAMRRGGE